MSPRVALVTGSGRKRVGWHVADLLADQGFDLAVHYRSSEQEARETVAHLQAKGRRADAFRADLVDEHETRRCVAEVLERFGRLDALVTCAAIWEPKPLEAVTAEDLRHYFDINTVGTFVCAQQAGLAMSQQAEGGSIVLVGDWAVVRPYRNYAAYFPSKGAIPTLTRTLAVEFAERNPKVRVNCVLPGPVMLPADLPAEEREEAIRATLVKREGTPQHVAKAIWHLIENDFLTGVCLPVDGGRSIA